MGAAAIHDGGEGQVHEGGSKQRICRPMQRDDTIDAEKAHHDELISYASLGALATLSLKQPGV